VCVPSYFIFPVDKSFKTDRRDKPKHSGRLGATSGPKKGGGGGKGTWGRPGDESKLNDQVDPDDPNFDEEQQEFYSNWAYHPEPHSEIKFASSLSDLQNFKKQVKLACAEYLQSNDAEEFCRIVSALGMSVFHQDLPAILIKQSFDFNDAERVRVSNLLHALHKAGLVTHLQMGAGVRKLYNSLHDLLVDAPQAKIHLREHVQFCVAAGILDASLAKQLEEEQEHLNDEATVAALKKKIDSIVVEFFRSESLPDAVVALRELNAPYLNFEIVKRLISHSLDQGFRQKEGASIFLADQAGALLSQADIEKGFIVLLERVDDLVLDVPMVLRDLSLFVARAVVDEVLPPAFLVRVDLGQMDAGSQVLLEAQRLLRQPDSTEALADAWDALEANSKKAKAEAEKEAGAK
jgi:hypothetical protein